MNEDLASNEAFTKVHFDFEHLPYLTNPRNQLKMRAVALGMIQLPPDEGYTFTHSHAQQEEVYIVIEGQGTMLIDGELIAIGRGDLVRVSPSARRALKAATEAVLFVICVGGVASGYPKNPGSRYSIDDGTPYYDDIPSWYHGRPDVVERNAKLKERMLKAQAKRQQQDKPAG